jgi:hypothetical protein
MRFIAFWYATKKGVRPNQNELTEIYKLFGEMAKAGVLVDKGGWDPSSPSTVLRKTSGKVLVTDGPFAETKEVIGGFLILQVASKDEVLNWCKRWTELGGDGFSEIREIWDPSSK